MWKQEEELELDAHLDVCSLWGCYIEIMGDINDRIDFKYFNPKRAYFWKNVSWMKTKCLIFGWLFLKTQIGRYAALCSQQILTAQYSSNSSNFLLLAALL